MTKRERFEGCIIGSAIGDAMGSGYENLPEKDDSVFHLFEKPKFNSPDWQITDDTQLTMATCEVLIGQVEIKPEFFAQKFLSYFKRKKLTGLGGSTLKALRDLDAGAHWSQSGRIGEFAAGNGAAMRIAPLAFVENVSIKNIQEISSITHLFGHLMIQC